MAKTSKESDKYKSVTQVSSLTDYIKWVNKIGEQNMLFRGIGNVNWKIASSLCRRLQSSGIKNDKDIDGDIFLEMTEILIKRARTEGYDIETIPELNDLELLANLQHYGAATCLIDFTKHPLTALCFACESANNKTGKVIAFNSNNATSYETISIDERTPPIEYWLTKYETEKKPFIFSPKKRNNRIVSQQSVFVFGGPIISDENFHICKITNKKNILEELKKNSISSEILFDDFVGFCSLNSHSKKYENWDTNSDFVSGRICQACKDFKSAIKYYDKAIISDPKDWSAYNNRGNAKKELANSQKGISKSDKDNKFQDAISDYDRAIELNPKNTIIYYNRGNTKSSLGQFIEAISDYDASINFNPTYLAYNNRGNAKNELVNSQESISKSDKDRKLQEALSDYDNAIKLNSELPLTYKNRGLIKYLLNDIKGAKDDFAKAKEIDPKIKVPSLPSDNSDK